MACGDAPAEATQEILERYGGVPVASDVNAKDRGFICQAREDIARLLDDREGLLRGLQNWRSRGGREAGAITLRLSKASLVIALGGCGCLFRLVRPYST